MELFTMLLVLFMYLNKAIAVSCGKLVCPAGVPYCTFTDAWRQFNYTCTLGHLVNPDNQTVQLHAYNWTCDQIGYSPAVEIGKPFNFNSNLSSVVVINFNDSAYPPSFMYAGKKYGQNATGTMLPNATCYNSGGQYACETQFDCGKEVNMADVNGGKTWRESAIATEEITLDEDDRRLADGEGMKEL